MKFTLPVAVSVRKPQILWGGAILLGAIGLVAYVSQCASCDAPQEAAVASEGAAPLSSDATALGPASVAKDRNVLVASTQNAGDSVVMSMVAIAQDGWIAVHDVLPDGSHGAILGARRFAAGTYFGERVELLRATRPGSTYAAVLHADDGDALFDFTIEEPVRDEFSSRIAEVFLATPLSE